MYSTIEQGEQTKVLSPHPVRGPLEGCEENTGFEKKKKKKTLCQLTCKTVRRDTV